MSQHPLEKQKEGVVLGTVCLHGSFEGPKWDQAQVAHSVDQLNNTLSVRVFPIIIPWDRFPK